ncbi:MAG: hypothetical protein J5871_01880 [Bacteroidales bacterium]|nr:hypothetical protein [Bacteroidales bacterium]
MSGKTFLWLPLCCLLLCACGQQGGQGRMPGRFVSDILADRSRPERGLLAAHGEPDRYGTICLAGSPDACRILADMLCAYDRFDNVSGAFHADGLPDFSGETLAVVCDEAYAPYAAMLNDGREEQLRTIAVHHALSALDTVMHASRYDWAGLRRKVSSKMLVLCDPLLCAYGKFDIDTLFASFSCPVPVLSSLDLMMDAVPPVSGRGVNAGVLCERQFVGSGVYAMALQRRAAPGMFPTCFAAEADSAAVLRTFLDAYAAAGETRPLDVLLVDDARVDIGLLAEELADMQDVSCALSLQYGKYLASEFRIIASRELLAQACYRTLRVNNIFTHYICGPKAEFYVTVPPLDEDAGGFMLVPYVQD